MRRRRIFLLAVGGLATGALAQGTARPGQMEEAMRKVTGPAPVRPGKVKLDLPPLVENGNAVALTVSVESPITGEDHVRAIHVCNEKNPQPNIASFVLGPRAGRATVSTRVRLADSQVVTAIAQMSDGSFWSAQASVIVTLAACTEMI